MSAVPSASPRHPAPPDTAGGWMALLPREEGWLGLIARLGIGLSPELLDLGELRTDAGYGGTPKHQQ